MSIETVKNKLNEIHVNSFFMTSEITTFAKKTRDILLEIVETIDKLEQKINIDNKNDIDVNFDFEEKATEILEKKEIVVIDELKEKTKRGRKKINRKE